MADRKNKKGDGSSGSSTESHTDGQNRSGSDRSSSNIGSRPADASGYGASGSDAPARGSKSVPPRKRLADEAVTDSDTEDFDDVIRP